MPAILKGTASITVPADAKPGDVIEVKGVEFTADQEDYDRALAARLAQQKRQHQKEVEELDRLHKEELEKLKGDGKPAPDNAALKKLEEETLALKNKLAATELKTKVDAALAAAGLEKAPAVYRNSLNLKADATDEDIAEAVKKLADDADLKKLLGETVTPPKPVGNRGGSGSGDRDDNKTGALLLKAQRNQPQLYQMLVGMPPDEQKTTLADWEAQGSLEPASKK